MEQKIKIDQFMDGSGRVTLLPHKQKVRYALLEYLSEKFKMDYIYTEKQVNEICNQWHTFGDYFLLRRELIDNGFLCRERDGSRYWRIAISPSQQK